MCGIFHSDHPVGYEKVTALGALHTVALGTEDAQRIQVRHTHALEKLTVPIKSLGVHRDTESASSQVLSLEDIKAWQQLDPEKMFRSEHSLPGGCQVQPAQSSRAAEWHGVG